MISQNFIKIVKEFRRYLETIKYKFDSFDTKNYSDVERIDFVEREKWEVFSKLDKYFSDIWELSKNLNPDDYKESREYYKESLIPLIGDPAAINKQIYTKPLGYSGDYITMNYIYDYHKDKYLGNSSYEKIINNYTCNIPFSSSNIVRKNLVKDVICETLQRNNEPRILSVGSGPMRELIELLEECKINKRLTFYSLDLEKKAIDYSKQEVSKIAAEKRKLLNIIYLHKNIIDILRDKNLSSELQGQDLIYASGIFDYLGERIAARTVKQLFRILNKNGRLLICNASAENCSHKAYFEMLGDWIMVYRTKQDMLKWTQDLKGEAKIQFIETRKPCSYLFLEIIRL